MAPVQPLQYFNWAGEGSKVSKEGDPNSGIECTECIDRAQDKALWLGGHLGSLQLPSSNGVRPGTKSSPLQAFLPKAFVGL